MGIYKQKWLQILKRANLQGWEIQEIDEGIFIDMPNVKDLKLIRDTIPSVIAGLTLDIETPKEQLKFIFHNGYESFEYVLNPGS